MGLRGLEKVGAVHVNLARAIEVNRPYLFV